MVVRWDRVRSGLYECVRMAYRWPWRPGGAGAGLLLVAWAAARLGYEGVAWRVAGAGALVLAAVTGWWWVWWVARPHTTKGVVRRRAELDQRRAGSATPLDIAQHASPANLRMRARVLRPSMRDLSWWARRRTDPRQLGVLVVKLGLGWWGQQVWSSCEDATLRIGGPRTGKTISMACYALDAPGALITTSTRLDLAEWCHLTRAARGRVQVFNPAGLGGVASTVRWRLLSGCQDFPTAERRAVALMPETSSDGERWDAQGRRILAILLHAAALAGGSMQDVVRWTNDAGEATQAEITTALKKADGDGARTRIAYISAHWAINERTRSSINATMSVPLAWMSNDRARALADPDPDETDLLDIADLITSAGTLHLLGHEDHTSLSPLIAALVAEIAHTARTLAAASPGRRLDPPLTMVLDEAAIVAPVPLDKWTADMGGHGVTIHISVQSLSQLRGRWGDQGAGAILGNVAAMIIFGGSPSASDLADISSLTGEYRMRILDTGRDSTRANTRTPRSARMSRAARTARAGQDPDLAGVGGEAAGWDRPDRWDQHRWVHVMAPHQIREMRPGEVLVLRRDLHTVIGTAPRIVDRRGWKPATLPTEHTPGVPTVQELDAIAGLSLSPIERVRHSRLARRLGVRTTSTTAGAGVRRERSTRPTGRADTTRPGTTRPGTRGGPGNDAKPAANPGTGTTANPGTGTTDSPGTRPADDQDQP